SINGSGVFTKAGTATLTLAGANSYSGATVVNGGTLNAGSATAFGTSTSLAVNTGATVGFGGFSQSFNQISGNGTIAFSAGETLSVGASNASNTFGGALTGNGNLSKLGTGTLTLNGSSSYSGTTAVSAGTLVAGNAGAFGNSKLFTVSGGATLDLNGFSQDLSSVAGTGTVALT